MTNNNNSVDVSAWIANAIADTGCRVVYGGHGGALVPLVNAICRHPDLTWVCARNEHDAATMAAAHAKMTGGLGVVIATSGPGASNLTTGLMEAVMDRVSVLAITGLKARAQLGFAEFQDINQSRLFAAAGVEWSKDATSPDGVLPLLRDAVATALTHHDCAHLAIPVDIQAAPSPLPLKHFCASHANMRLETPMLDPKVLDETAATLVGEPDKRRPRNIIALGLRASYYSENNMSKAILDLAEALNAPVLTRLHAKGTVDEMHPLSLGVIGVHGKPGLEEAATLVSSSDLVLSIGVDDETLLVCNLAGLQIRKIIEMDSDYMCLNTRFQADHTIVGNIEQACRELTSRVEVLTAKVNKKRAIKAALSEEEDCELVGGALDKFSYMMHNNPDAVEVSVHGNGGNHHKRISLNTIEKEGLGSIVQKSDELWEMLHSGDWRKIADMHNAVRYKFVSDSQASEQHFCHPSDVLHALSTARMDEKMDHVARDAVIAVDVGDVTLWASLCLTLKGGSRTLYSERLGTMGYGLNAGIASILARPAPAGAVVLAGDGGFQMTLQELATFQQMKRPGDKLLCIVFDNQVLGRVAFGFDNAEGCTISGPDYVALAKSYGGDGVRLDKSSDADEVVRKAMAAEGLFMLHVLVDPSVKADMASFHDNSIQVMNSG